MNLNGPTALAAASVELAVTAVMALAATRPLPRSQNVPLGSSFVIVGARVADGTGGPLRLADVRVESGRIAEVGDIKARRGEAR